MKEREERTIIPGLIMAVTTGNANDESPSSRIRKRGMLPSSAAFES